MCNLTLFTYSCSCTHLLRHSTCLGNFALPPPDDLFAACDGKRPSQRIAVHSLCGPCSRRISEAELEKAFEERRVGFGSGEFEDSAGHRRRVQAEEELNEGMREVYQQFPGRVLGKVISQPRKRMEGGVERFGGRREKKFIGSRLRNEVKEEDIPKGWGADLVEGSGEGEGEEGGGWEMQESGAENEGWAVDSVLEEIGDETGEKGLPDGEVGVEDKKKRKIPKGGLW